MVNYIGKVILINSPRNMKVGSNYDDHKKTTLKKPKKMMWHLASDTALDKHVSENINLHVGIRLPSLIFRNN